MAEFKNVSVAKAANIFFEGRITSRSIIFEDGSRKTLGIMLPGEYELNTVHKEVMDIQTGVLESNVTCRRLDGSYSTCFF